MRASERHALDRSLHEVMGDHAPPDLTFRILNALRDVDSAAHDAIDSHNFATLALITVTCLNEGHPAGIELVVQNNQTRPV